MYPFRAGSYAPKNGWYVAGFCEEIGEALLSRWILNQPVVLYRKEDGRAVAVEGRCPHRHFPLGESKRIGDAIQCGYHGITFDAAGKCTFVPSQTAIPGVYSIKSYPLVERGLWAWIWMGDAEKCDEALLPTLDEIGFNIEGLIPQAFYSMPVDGRYQLLNDNLLDLTHLGYLHSSSIGTPDDAATPEVRDLSDRRLSSRRYIRDTEIPPMHRSLTGHQGLVDRVSGMDFFFPGFHAGIGEMQYPRDHERAGDIIRTSRVWHAVTPATKNSCNYFFAMSGRSLEDLSRAKISLEPVLKEDKFATEQIEKIISTLDELPPELMLKSDATTVQGRRILQAMMDREMV
ncbi:MULTISPECIES: aromatic ring-hydroxylating dioxygenase subunit alpha [unclassified Sphingobium]|uniref:aromatic ring-hydroxylating dioxygenase subunit alpha n=1 Tax=unclassified Sphingobium TaxID=2611147 RepID=UPI0022246843|nr:MULTISPECIES: aromatic ring-hydroxylating dioxygenase subunit alpha [unclassified Sphingobium]MCW2411548.1 vanillate O-demethylase monooxygenase subunit [Sphingobium sp. B8D3D]MCW2416159.1 vanillate O-demethylase monooxygenase subunit [Sphingobium sp. B8D3A]